MAGAGHPTNRSKRWKPWFVLRLSWMKKGPPTFGGTTAKAIKVVLNKEWAGQAPEELQQDMPHLTLAQINAALAH